MNSVHDMGGMHGMGPVVPEPEGGPFHGDWEGRVHALVLASPTRGNIDAGRHRRERIPGPAYLSMTYYQRWLAGLCGMLLEAGLVTPAEMASGRADPTALKATPRIGAEAVAPAQRAPFSYEREVQAPPAFKPGDPVRCRNLNPAGHTRLPRYARGRRGEIVAHRGAHVFPDSHAHGLGEDPRHLYSVRFAARELWGPDASPRDSVILDLWEPYLERA